MKKKQLLLFTLIFSMFLIISPISVKAINNSYNDNNIIMASSHSEEKIMKLANDASGGGGGTAGCGGFLTEDAILLLHQILSYIRVIAPLLVIVFSTIDFTRAVLGKYDNKEDSLETAKIKVGKRLLACILLFFIPTILKIVLNTYKGSISIDPSCIDKVR